MSPSYKCLPEKIPQLQIAYEGWGPLHKWGLKLALTQAPGHDLDRRVRDRPSSTSINEILGIKGLSKNVIEQVWREGRLEDLHDTRVAMDAVGRWPFQKLEVSLCLVPSLSFSCHPPFLRVIKYLTFKEIPELEGIQELRHIGILANMSPSMFPDSVGLADELTRRAEAAEAEQRAMIDAALTRTSKPWSKCAGSGATCIALIFRQKWAGWA